MSTPPGASHFFFPKGRAPLMSWGSDALGVTEDTFEMIKAVTSGITTGAGVAGIHMDDLISWVPVDTPFFDSTPRKGAPQGALFAVWQALQNINNTQPDGGVQADYAAPLVNIENQYMYSPFATIGAGGTVSWDALSQGQNYADVLAVDTLQSINQQLISLDIHQLNAQSFALPACPAPTLSPVASGGTIPTATAVYVKCAARSGLNYYRGGSGVASGEATVTTAAASSSVTGFVTAVKGAAAYDWFVGGAAGGEVYYTTTSTNTVTVTFVPTGAQKVPALAGIYNSGNPGPAVPAADSSYQPYWQNGLTASILGDFSASLDQLGLTGTVANLVTPGTGTPQGAYYQSLDGGQLTVSGAAVEQIDAMNRSIYDTYQLTPNRMLVSSQVINDLADAVLDSPQAITWLPIAPDGRDRVTVGGAVAIYLNKTVNGKPITLELQPHLPPGMIVSVVDEVPFPGANIATTLEVETLYDFFRFDYGANRETGVANGGPRYDFEVRSRQAFKNKASALMGVLCNIAPGLS